MKNKTENKASVPQSEATEKLLSNSPKLSQGASLPL